MTYRCAKFTIHTWQIQAWQIHICQVVVFIISVVKCLGLSLLHVYDAVLVSLLFISPRDYSFHLPKHFVVDFYCHKSFFALIRHHPCQKRTVTGSLCSAYVFRFFLFVPLAKSNIFKVVHRGFDSWRLVPGYWKEKFWHWSGCVTVVFIYF